VWRCWGPELKSQAAILSERTVVRVFATVVLTALAVVVVVYFLNPLRTASSDPRLRVAGFTLFRTPSRSMQPTIRQNDTLLVSAWPYRKANPQPGDIVVFQYPLDPSVVFVKRVMAAGGSTVQIVDGVTIVNGKPLNEPYVDTRNNSKEYSRYMSLVQVPANAFFVMGDNRDDSDDSRAWGFVPRSHIVGKVDSVSGPDNRWRSP
jgi:signal peptidase I